MPVDQDQLVRPALKVLNRDSLQVWVKEQQDLGRFQDSLPVRIAAHGVLLLKVSE